METSIRERLIRFIKYKNITQKKFEQMVGASNGYVNNIRMGIGTNKLEQILSCFPDLNKVWLLTGEGEMIRQEKESSTTINDHHTSVEGNSNQVNATSTLDKALDEIAAQRRLVEKAQEQIDRLISLLEKQHQ